MLIDYIKEYNDVLTKEICEQLIKLFDYQDYTQNYNQSNSTYLKFQEIIVKDNVLCEQILDRTEKIKRQYFIDCKIKYLPSLYNYELLRVKKYNNNGVDQFGNHIDCYDKVSGQRYLAFLFYLNNISDGGVTEFLDPINHTVVPQQGKVLIFPPTFLFPHAGHKPVDTNKYVLSTYLHFA